MRYGSVCSGIEAASVAWHPLGWEAAFLSEIEPFPCSVLSHHYPTVPNMGDMTKFKEWDNYAIDVLVGGTPCQSFSVAGLRKGLDDPRGNLMLTYLALADRYRPRWLVWENVPGVLSSNGGRDFGTFLGGLGELGYGFAYRVLDAQYFGVAQRRRRVFVVGCLGDWRGAAAVLFERHSLQGNTPPRREKGQEVAGTFTSRARSGGWSQDVDLAAGGYMRPWPADVASCLDAHFGDKMGLENQHINQGAPLFVPSSAYSMITANTNANGLGVSKEITPTLDRAQPCAVAYPINTQIAMRCEALGEGTGLGIGADGDPGYTLQAAHSHAVAFGGDIARTLSARYDSSPCADRGMDVVSTGMQVRRLTPMECERLQGFPDGYTLVPHRGKPAADGPRYKALGNSMAVPVMGWIGKRIKEADMVSH